MNIPTIPMMPNLKLNLSWEDWHLLSPTSLPHIYSVLAGRWLTTDPSVQAEVPGSRRPLAGRSANIHGSLQQRGWLRPLKVFKLKCSLIGLNADPLLQGEELAAAFMGALFSVLHDTIVDARRGRSKHEARKIFDYHWSVPDVTRPTYSPAMTTMRRSDHART